MGRNNAVVLILAAAIGSALASGCGAGQSRSGVAVTAGGGLAAVPDVDPQISAPQPASLAKDPVAPTQNGNPLAWASAPLLQNVTVAASRDSALVGVPVVPGAADYRVFALSGNVTITSTGSTEAVGNADIYCAGNRQFNAPPPLVPQVVQQIEVLNLQGPTQLVVEAIDSLCPFPGMRGTVAYSSQVTSGEVPPSDRVAETLYTEAQMRSAYGNSLFLNGQSAAPTLAAQAPNVAPTVLARTTLNIQPMGNATPELAYFDDFSDATDVPQMVQQLKTFSDRNSNAQLLQNKRWSFYQTNYDDTDLLVDRGALQMTLLDRYQDTFGTNFMMPRRPVAIADADYLHVSWTVQSDATQRRYWWLFLCGAAEAGQTYDAAGNFLGSIVNTPFFYQPDGLNPSTDSWNCLQVFPRDGEPFALPPDNTRPQSDIRVMLNQNGAPARDNVINVSPDQYASVPGSAGVAETVGPSWYRQQDAQGNLVGAILDDQMLIAPRTRYDAYISRSRLILLVNGAQRLCNDFTKYPLTMAEGALGLGQVLYHSTAEREEFSDSFNNRTGQRYYLTDSPYVDVRSWDNVGYMEHTRAPSSFDSSLCYNAQ